MSLVQILVCDRCGRRSSYQGGRASELRKAQRKLGWGRRRLEHSIPGLEEKAPRPWTTTGANVRGEPWTASGVRYSTVDLCRPCRDFVKEWLQANRRQTG